MGLFEEQNNKKIQIKENDLHEILNKMNLEQPELNQAKNTLKNLFKRFDTDNNHSLDMQ
jgi:hypothetical protein